MSHIITYCIYLMIMAINGIVISECNLTIRNWQTWVLTLNTVIVYLCGYVRGGL